MKLAIIGAGPSGFYAASRLLSIAQSKPLQIHMFDRLGVPHGLVRYGVAPDHPEVKNCVNKFDEAATDPRFHFFGKVSLAWPNAPNGTPITRLLPHYSHVLFATGCPNPRVHPRLPLPSQSTSVLSALDVVHWYTGHPSSNIAPPLPLGDIRNLSIVGVGNVGLDIARILLTPPALLEKEGYDFPAHVLSKLHESYHSLKHINIIGRRGPYEASFTAKELRELISLGEHGVHMTPIPEEHFEVGTRTLTRQQKRVSQLLRDGTQKYAAAKAEKTWSVDFFRDPIQLTDSKLTLAHTTVDPLTLRSQPTTDTSVIQSDLTVLSLGFEDSGVHALIGQLTSSTSGMTPLPRLYATGWANTGAKGVIANSMRDAYEVADSMWEDWVLTEADKGPMSLPGNSSWEEQATEVAKQLQIDRQTIQPYPGQLLQ